MGCPRARSSSVLVLASLFGILVGAVASPAFARSGGIATSACDGCHSGPASSVTAFPMPSTFGPGDEIVIEVVVSASSMASAGVFIEVEGGVGSVRTLTGEGLVQVDTGLAHARPKSATNGSTRFRFAWRAPNAPGSVRLNIAAVAANGDLFFTGDRPGEEHVDLVFGCEPQRYYLDFDLDGYGRDEVSYLRCAGDSTPGWATVAGDCNDNRETIYPGAPELCNQRDDDCDEIIDEDAELVELWPDPDGDGYYQWREGEPIFGCVPTRGYAAEPGDCDESNPDVNIDAPEVCNDIDDNCDGRIDERVRPYCGVGQCARWSPSCEPDHCTPGDPEPEVCNGLDDDCDDLVDNGATCAAGEVCVAGQCLVTDELPPGGTPDTPPSSPPGANPVDGGPEAPGSVGKSSGSGCAVANESSRGFTFLLFLLAISVGAFRRRRR